MKAAQPRFNGRLALSWLGLGAASAIVVAIAISGNVVVLWQ